MEIRAMEKKYDIFISYRREGGLMTADVPESGKWFGKAAFQGSETAKVYVERLNRM